ncbi:phage Gp19/Gp15/Gp42 family protein [Enterococcus sp. DIV1059_2]|uniref:phage Gp19/Gp15/Gp42 family protein n=1 Tax=Enterococcus sp. DIV1059_2 TaxID=2774664 RepID=UPI003F688324
MTAFATIEDLTSLWRALKPEELSRATELLNIVSDSLRMEADKVGKDLDTMISMKPDYFLNVVKSVTVDVVARTLMTSTDQEPMTQYAEGALGYSVSGSYLVPGGGLFIKNSELSRLGLKRQRMGVIEPYGTFKGHNNPISGIGEDGF